MIGSLMSFYKSTCEAIREHSKQQQMRSTPPQGLIFSSKLHNRNQTIKVRRVCSTKANSNRDCKPVQGTPICSNYTNSSRRAETGTFKLKINILTKQWLKGQRRQQLSTIYNIQHRQRNLQMIVTHDQYNEIFGLILLNLDIPIIDLINTIDWFNLIGAFQLFYKVPIYLIYLYLQLQKLNSIHLPILDLKKNLSQHAFHFFSIQPIFKNKIFINRSAGRQNECSSLLFIFRDRWKFQTQQLLQYQNYTKTMHHSNQSKNSRNRGGQLKNQHEPVIVEIKIGTNIPVKSIRIDDIHNMEKINTQISFFISQNKLKEGAFQFIKSLICKQIDRKKTQKSRDSTGTAQKCKYQAIMQEFEKKQKKKPHLMTSPSNSMMSNITFSKTPEKYNSKHPEQIIISLDQKTAQYSSINTKKEEELQSFVFNSSFTLPSSIGQKNPVFFTDQLFQHAFQTHVQHKNSHDFTNLSQFQTKQKVEVYTMNDSPIKLKIRQNQLEILSPKFAKNSKDDKDYTPKKQGNSQSALNEEETQNKQASQTQKKLKSTRQRKLAIITPKHAQNMESSKPNLLIMNAQNLSAMVSQHQRNFKQMKEKMSKHTFQSPQTEKKCLPEQNEEILMALFEKLTQNNPSEVKQLHPQYVSYQKLGRLQLHLMGILFEKVDHKELNNLNYDNFKINSLKYCWNQIEQLVEQKSIKDHINNLRNDSKQIEFY